VKPGIDRTITFFIASSRGDALLAQLVTPSCTITDGIIFGLKKGKIGRNIGMAKEEYRYVPR
jgi:hypothetical protein